MYKCRVLREREITKLFRAVSDNGKQAAFAAVFPLERQEYTRHATATVFPMERQITSVWSSLIVRISVSLFERLAETEIRSRSDCISGEATKLRNKT